MLISKFGLANYITLFTIGFLIVLAVYKFKMPSYEIYSGVAGGVAFALYHYGFTEFLQSP